MPFDRKVVLQLKLTGSNDTLPKLYERYWAHRMGPKHV